MVEQVLHTIQNNHLLQPHQRVLVAVSGGLDSVVLLRILIQLGYKCEVAHVNFKLRGKASDGDADFVEELANRAQLPYYKTSFNTMDYASAHGISMEMAARDLRYAWFQSICKSNGLETIAVGHNRDDQVETFFMNLVRGSGLKGLSSIQIRNENIIRPLLNFSRKEIASFASENKLAWREDSSNGDENIRRNNFRHTIIPQLQVHNPSLNDTITSTIRKIRESRDIVDSYVSLWKDILQSQEGGNVKIKVLPLAGAAGAGTVLFELISPYGFNETQTQMIYDAMHGDSGKMFYSKTKRLLINRDEIIISDFKESEVTFVIEEDLNTSHLPFDLEIRRFAHLPELVVPKNRLQVWFDGDKVSFPLTLRRWKRGDAFHPFGMTGSKKLSDFFIDQKLSQIQKEKVWVLATPRHIVWIMGYRTDDRVKVTADTKVILELKTDPNQF